MINAVQRIAAVVGVLLLLGACTAKTNPDANPGVTVKVAGAASGPFVRGYNPLLLGAANGAGYSTQSIYEPLLQEDFAKGVTRPWLAESFRWGDGGKSLTVELRKDVTWSDGQPLTGEDVAFTFELLRKFPGLNTNGYPLAGAEAPGPNTAQIRFTEPSYQLMWWRTTPVPKHLWKEVKDPVTYANKNPVGTGPYRLKSFTSQVITLEKNPGYWQKGLPAVKTVRYIAFDSSSSMIAALQAGEVDWIGATGVDAAAVAKLDPKSIGYWNTKPNPAVVMVIPNHSVYPLNLPEVRQAMSLALDRTVISKIGTGGQNAPVESPTGLDVESRADLLAPAYADLRYGSADPAGAKRLLTGAGFTMGPDGVFRTPKGAKLSLTMLLPTNNPFGDFVRASKVMVKQWAAAGIEVKVKTEQQSAWREDTELGTFDLTMRPNGGTPAVYDFFNRIFSQELLVEPGKRTQRNYERYKNPEAGPLLKLYASSAARSAGEREALAGLQKLMVEDVPVIPLMFTAGLGLWRTDRVTGFPSESNPYAVPLPNSVNSEIVLTKLRPVRSP
ncbi:ABC transporter substrate-binding protein [Actinopolymorpha alba]|uniref:ABC transporter substrate-binding protein n=1 Tax=Actinopolymorpha alba TaxID=533267 RepID=UPI000360C5BF|nr:ABC transporter substrate-binding protein [Actinopolymorpha alba]